MILKTQSQGFSVKFIQGIRFSIKREQTSSHENSVFKNLAWRLYASASATKILCLYKSRPKHISGACISRHDTPLSRILDRYFWAQCFMTWNMPQLVAIDCFRIPKWRFHTADPSCHPEADSIVQPRIQLCWRLHTFEPVPYHRRANACKLMLHRQRQLDE